MSETPIPSDGKAPATRQMPYESIRPSPPHAARRPRRASLYPLELRLTIIGAVA